jgi:hypothetical protein
MRVIPIPYWCGEMYIKEKLVIFFSTLSTEGKAATDERPMHEEEV